MQTPRAVVEKDRDPAVIQRFDILLSDQDGVIVIVIVVGGAVDRNDDGDRATVREEGLSCQTRRVKHSMLL